MPDENVSPAPLASIFSGSAEQSPAPSAKTETPTEVVSEEPKSEVEEASSSEEKSKEEPKSTEEEATLDDKEEVTEEVDESLLSDEEKAAKKKEADEKAAADAKKKEETEAASKTAAEEATFKKRFEDTAKWAREVNAQNAQLREVAANQQRQLEILQKKVDGTWTDEDEAASKSSADTPEAVASRAVLAGKAVASNAAAIREFGKEKVDAVLTEFQTLFGNNNVVRQVVSEADSPVHSAMQMVERYHFEQQYGNTPQEWVKNIALAAEKQLRAVITKEIMDKIKTGKSTKESAPGSLASAKGSKGDEGKLKEVSPAPLEDIFNSNKRT